MRKLITAIALACALGAAAAAPAAAQSPVIVTIVRAELAARVQVTLTFTVVCDPLISWDGQQTTIGAFGAAATVDQAAGRSIAHAEGGDVMSNPSVTVVCDGSTMNWVSIPMISSTVPFHAGAAVASVSVNVDPVDCWMCGSGQHVDTSATVKLR